MNTLDEFLMFLSSSPSDFHAIENIESMVKTKASVPSDSLEPGKCYYFTRKTKDGSALIAANIGANAAENGYPLNIVVSHCDSPWFNVKEDSFVEREGVNLVQTEKYGGFTLAVWQDRPLTLAGRICIIEDGKEVEKTAYFGDDTFIVPSMCFHFARYVEKESEGDQGYPLVGDSELSSKGLKAFLAKKLDINEDSIVDYKLSFVSKQAPEIWGENKEYLSAPRLDDLACSYTSTKAFLNASNDNAINILYVADNEEIGSDTEVGARGSFLKETLSFIADKLGFDLDEALSHSFMLSADNAQGVHPHHEEIYNPNYKVYMNRGFAVKMSERYSTTEETLEIYKEFSKRAGVPCQVFYNRDDIKGGGTVGKLIQMIIPIKSADIGLPQLAMHSSYETMGTKDVTNAINTFAWFYGKFLLKDFE